MSSVSYWPFVHEIHYGFFCLFVWGLQFFTYMETSPLPVKGFIATALKLLKRISCNTVAKLYILFTCAFSQEILNRELWRKYSILCNLCETSLACVLYVNLNDREAVWICVWQWTSKCYTNVTIINQIYVLDYYQYLVMIFCLIAPSLIYGIVIGYV